MGYMRHHAIVVTGPKNSCGLSDHDIDTVQRDLHDMASPLVSGVIASVTNGYGTVLIAPDGSKEGWETSDRWNHIRDKVIGYLETLRYGDHSTSFDYVEVQYGDDDGVTCVLRNSDQA